MIEIVYKGSESWCGTGLGGGDTAYVLMDGGFVWAFILDSLKKYTKFVRHKSVDFNHLESECHRVVGFYTFCNMVKLQLRQFCEYFLR